MIQGADNKGQVLASRCLPHRVFRDDPVHARQLGQHAIGTQRGDVGIAPVTGQNQ